MFGNEEAAAKKEYFDKFGGEFRAIFKDVAREADSIAEQFKAALDTSQKAEKNTVERDGVRSSKDISEALSKAADSFSIKDINDGVHVQKMVFNSLSSEGFFSSGENIRVVKNKNTKSEIEINKSGIQETFGKSGNFANLGKKLKFLKLATVRDIPSLLENAVLIEENVKNKHKENSSVLFDYYRAETVVDGIPVTVDFDIKKSPQKNKFWVHRINVKENAEVNSSGADALKRHPNLDVNNSISKDNGNVNRYSKELFPDDRTMSAEEIERDEIEQYIQQIKSSDDLSDADVQAIRQEIIQSRKQQREQLLAEITCFQFFSFFY